ncbi:inner membrane protein YohC [bacterium BMS3Abin04]|nr:inner membrane protein YohC [bacterium BMS3Abin04]
MNIVERAKNILLKPKEEWEVIKNEETTVNALFTQYAVILAAIPAVAGLLGYSVFGMNFGFKTFRMPITTSFGWAVLTYILMLVGIYLIGFLIDTFAPTFGSTKNLTQSMKVAVYAYTASWVGGIFYIFPVLSFLVMLAGIYSLVLMYMGLKRVKDVPQEKMLGYFITVIVIAIIVYFVIGAITTAVVFSGYAMGAM